MAIRNIRGNRWGSGEEGQSRPHGAAVVEIPRSEANRLTSLFRHTTTRRSGRPPVDAENYDTTPRFAIAYHATRRGDREPARSSAGDDEVIVNSPDHSVLMRSTPRRVMTGDTT